MPQKEEDKWKAFFADLGRPTLRGIRKCPKCGTVNGTRGNVCKNKNCDVIFRGNGNRKKVSLETCQIYTTREEDEEEDCQDKLFSVRVRDRGPDYRTFVQVSGVSDDGDPESEDTSDYKCFVDTCAAVDQQTAPCTHVLATKKSCSKSEKIVVTSSALSTLNVPDEYYPLLSHMINEYPQLMVQRVSKCSFVVKCQKSDRHPLGYLHIMFMKTVKDDTVTYKKFLCNCRPFKVPSRDPESMHSDSSSGNFAFKLCLHFYACLCAFASDESLTSEFEHLLSSAAHEVPQPLLSHLHLVTLPHQSSTDKSGESLDPSQISVEIMRENISLLESIVAGDDTTLANVQGLEGVLADQIIVTNVDDSLSFGDAAVMDGLEETDQQVCQILGQNTIHLTTYTSSQSDQLHNLDIPANHSRNQDEQDCCREQNTGRKRKELHVSFPESSKTHNLVISQLPVIPTPMKSSNSQNTSSSNNGVSASESTSSIEKPSYLISFDNWLAGVNDRINATMNYQLPTAPEPMTYYVPNEYFEFLKERISSGGKKRRLPNHTVVFHRTDKAPLGTFTKHTWKITNILQVLHIFNCPIVQLKAKQFFVKTNAGNFVEWIPPKNEDEKNQRILPVLHSTFLKCGRNHGAGSKESIPFTIEWIPDIFTKSKLGELTIGFQFGKTGPIHENDDDARVTGVQSHAGEFDTCKSNNYAFK